MSRKRNGSVVDTKTRRLCRAAERIVASVLAEQDALTGCVLLDVIPVTGGRLVARVGLPNLTSAAEFEATWSAVRVVKARCRAELAATLSRKRTPEIEFELLPIAGAEDRQLGSEYNAD